MNSLNASAPPFSPNNLPETGPLGRRRLRAADDLEYFARAYFPDLFPTEPPPFHREAFALLNEIAANARQKRPGKRLAIAYPRGHSKTTIYSRVAVIHSLLYRWSPLTILIGNNDRSAKRLLKNIKDDLESNELLREDFPILHRPAKVWSATAIELADGCAVSVFGRGSGAIRGVVSKRRPTLVIGDDIEDDTSIRSEIETSALIEWWNRAVLAVGDNITGTTTYILVGTILARQSLFVSFAETPGVTALIYPALITPPTNTDLWAEWERHYTAHPVDTPEADTFYQQHKAELAKGATLLWDRPDALWYIYQYRLSRGELAFQRELQNNPYSDDTQPLGPLPESDPITGYRIAALDPTVSGAKTADYPAYVEIVFDPATKKAVLDYCLAERADYGTTVRTIADRIAQLPKPLDGLVVEANSAGAVIADLLQQELIRRGRTEVATQIYNKVPKAQRIAALAVYARRGQFAIRRGLGGEFVREWQSYPAVRNDDALDAAATAMRFLEEQRLLLLSEPNAYFFDPEEL